MENEKKDELWRKHDEMLKALFDSWKLGWELEAAKFFNKGLEENKDVS